MSEKAQEECVVDWKAKQNREGSEENMHFINSIFQNRSVNANLSHHVEGKKMEGNGSTGLGLDTNEACQGSNVSR